MEQCFAIFANVLELDRWGEPVNENMPSAVLPRGSTSTAQANCRQAKLNLRAGNASCTDAIVVGADWR
jgi:hypothetical protein